MYSIKIIATFCLVYILKSLNAQSCGKAGAPVNGSRIVGGEVSQPGQWPWMAYIEATFDESGVNRTYRCGGSIISEEWVLTAAHCLKSAQSYPLVIVKLLVGANNLGSLDGSEVRLTAEKVIPHESYSFDSNVNDIGLLKLDSKLDLSGNNPRIGAICLPKNRQTTDRNKCYGIGWGRTSEGGQPSSVLRHVRLPIQSNFSCSLIWTMRYHSQSQLCAGYLTGGRDTCQGDSGGPLVCPFGGGLWLQEGITSFGIGCARPIMPGVYTRVSYYLPWISKNTGIVFE